MALYKNFVTKYQFEQLEKKQTKCNKTNLSFIVGVQFPSALWAYEVVWISFRPSEPDTGVQIPIGSFNLFLDIY
jgi:hypothetical protein